MPNTGLPQDWADWKRSALTVTGHFEDSSDPMGAVSGDFDEQGISLGVLQWNIGQGSLQPLVRNIGQAGVLETMPTYGRELWRAATVPQAQGLAIVRSWQTGPRIRADVMRELKAFTHGDAFVRQQIAAAETTAVSALRSAREWAAEVGEVPDKALFCWFFDLLTQNGGLKTVTPAGAKSFINGFGRDKADDAICDWLTGRGSEQAGYRDARKNADLWRNSVPPSRLVIFAASFLRSGLSRLPYRADVMNRKGTIALGTGWVHLERHDLTAILGL